MPTTRRVHLFASIILASLVAAAPAAGAVATALLYERGPLPGAPLGHTVNSLSNTAVNQIGGYAASVNSSNGVVTLSHIWGSAAGGPGGVLRTEGTFGPLVQTAFESFYGMSNSGSVAYSATGTGGPVGAFDSVWLDDTPLAVEGDPITSIAGQFWRFASRPGVTGSGVPYWVGGITSVAGGGTENYGLFYGAGATVVLLGGQVVPDLPFPLSLSSSVGFDYRYSALGTHYIAPVIMASPSSANNDAVVMDGSGLMAGGTLLREQNLVPVAAGGNGVERWFAFDFMGITENGDWLVTGDTDAPVATDEFVMKNGVILYREGDVLDGRTLTGAIEGAYMNENGDVAYVWDVVDATALEALYVNDQLALVEGDLVDLSGDGIVEPNSRLVDFTGISALTMGNRDLGGNVDVYFMADIDTLGTTSATDDVEGFFRLRVLVDGSTATLASLAGANAGPDRVEIVWSVATTLPATVYRSDDGSSWIPLLTASADGAGMLRVVDHDVVPGRRYGYRLGFMQSGTEVTAGETFVTVPTGARLALLGAYPNPSRGPAVSVSFSLPDAAPASVELLDVGGRRVASREVGGLGPGNHTVALEREASRLPAGVYLVRLVHGGSVLTDKAAIIR
jgi:hypothetical protein